MLYTSDLKQAFRARSKTFKPEDAKSAIGILAGVESGEQLRLERVKAMQQRRAVGGPIVEELDEDDYVVSDTGF